MYCCGICVLVSNVVFCFQCFDMIGVIMLFFLLFYGVLLFGIMFQFVKLVFSLLMLDVILVNVVNQQVLDKVDFLVQVNNCGGGDCDCVEWFFNVFIGLLFKFILGIVSVCVQVIMFVLQLLIDQCLVIICGDSWFSVDVSIGKLQVISDLNDCVVELCCEQEIVQFVVELCYKNEVYVKWLKKKYIFVNICEYVYVVYMCGWFDWVECIGNFNYLSEVWWCQLYGELLFMVGFNCDGGISSIEVIKSFGLLFLDVVVECIVWLVVLFLLIFCDKGVDELYIMWIW